MKFKSKIYYVLLLLITIAGYWVLPALGRIMTDEAENYPFVYYSSVLRDLCFVEYDDRANPIHDAKGNVYTTQQFDSLLPLLNYRQLIADGTLPDSLEGRRLTPALLADKNVVFRFSPDKIFKPECGLYVMYESKPKRLNEPMPTDVFRFTDGMTFIDTQTNDVEKEKSAEFTEALKSAGYRFPAQWIRGDLNPMKAYDEGYFSLDNSGELFHIKMVSGKPYVRNTHLSKTIKVDQFVMSEVKDRRLYGYLFDKEGSVYIIENHGEVYVPVKLGIDPIDVKKNELLIMGNLLYWTVTVDKGEQQLYYGLTTNSLNRVAKYTYKHVPGKWDEVPDWLFPVCLTIEHGNTQFITPRLQFMGYAVFVTNLLLALLSLLVLDAKGKNRIFITGYILVTGITGWIALCLLGTRFRRYKRRTQQDVCNKWVE